MKTRLAFRDIRNRRHRSWKGTEEDSDEGNRGQTHIAFPVHQEKRNQKEGAEEGGEDLHGFLLQHTRHEEPVIHEIQAREHPRDMLCHGPDGEIHILSSRGTVCQAETTPVHIAEVG